MAMNRPSRWHFPRTDLAQAYLQQLEAGLNSIAIFAERRKGKTEFLTEDLQPCARARGLRTAYINFWERKSDPVYCITQGVRRALEADSPRLLRKWKKEFTIKLGVFQAKRTASAEQHPEIASEALDLLIAPKGGLLLMFDEIQHLATDPGYEELIATLRTFLDSNKKKVRAVFTGSSQDRLNKIFRNQRAAFYRGASLVNFPDMGEDFIRFLVNNFTQLTTRNLPAERAFEIFAAHHHSPFVIVDLLQTMMGEGIYDFDEGLSFYLQVNNPNEQWQELWESLKPVDQLVLKLVILPSRPLYHIDTYQLIGDKLGIERVSRGVVQSSVRRLREQGILNNEGRGQWTFESMDFKRFVSSDSD